MFNYLDQGDRKRIIDQILNSEENKLRKNESLMKYEIYKGRQYPFLVQKILKELGPKAALNSRIISSVNVTKKIIDEQSRIYLREPEREFTELTEEQENHVDKIYEYGKADVKFKKLNRIFKLNQQAALQIIPKDGVIEFRPLYPHHYDVIPKANDPEKPECYIISSYDKSNLFNQAGTISSGSSNPVYNRGYYSDQINQKIGDPDDYSGNQLLYWWTDEYNFITDKNGNYVDKEGNFLKVVDEKDVLNPIGKRYFEYGCMPFIDVAIDKDFEFYVRGGNNITDFSLEFALMLSDTSEISRLQGFAQAILASKEEPQNLKIGPRNYLWLRLDPNDTDSARPSFSFASPNADIASSLQLLSSFASMFLTSIGQDPSIVAALGDSNNIQSAAHKFLIMLEKFEQSADDIDLFKWVEQQAYGLVKLWNNVLYNVTDNGLVDDLSGVSLPEESRLMIKYAGPSMDLTEKEKLELIEKKRDLGLIDQVGAVMMDRDVDKERAKEIIAEMEDEFNRPMQKEASVPKLPLKDPLDEDESEMIGQA